VQTIEKVSIDFFSRSCTRTFCIKIEERLVQTRPSPQTVKRKHKTPHIHVTTTETTRHPTTKAQSRPQTRTVKFTATEAFRNHLPRRPPKMTMPEGTRRHRCTPRLHALPHCGKTTSEMRGLSPKIISGNSR
jgi:hypothetical protein